MKLLESRKIALLKIKELTIDDNGRKNKVITNNDFEQDGLKGRHIIIKDTNDLVEKGLIFKFKDDDKFFRYTLTKRALCMFSDNPEWCEL